MRRMTRFATAGVIALLVITSFLYHQSEARGSDAKLSVLYAGSMTKTMETTIGPAFHQSSGVTFEGEGAGSRALAQMIRSGLRQPDVFISASPSVNDEVLMGSKNKNYVTWYMTVARDSLVLAYGPKGKFSSSLKQSATGKTTWYEILEKKGFLLGRTDPKLDPKGAYTVLMFKLAARYYHQPNLANQILGATENPAQVFPEETLLARLNTGQLDGIVAYRHEAIEWGVPYITLPSSIDLGDPTKANLYASASLNLGHGKVTKGSPIVFTVTIPKTAMHVGAAEAFVIYLVSGRGHTLLLKDGFTATPTYVGGSTQAIPKSLRGLVRDRSS